LVKAHGITTKIDSLLVIQEHKTKSIIQRIKSDNIKGTLYYFSTTIPDKTFIKTFYYDHSPLLFILHNLSDGRKSRCGPIAVKSGEKIAILHCFRSYIKNTNLTEYLLDFYESSILKTIHNSQNLGHRKKTLHR